MAQSDALSVVEQRSDAAICVQAYSLSNNEAVRSYPRSEDKAVLLEVHLGPVGKIMSHDIQQTTIQ